MGLREELAAAHRERQRRIAAAAYKPEPEEYPSSPWEPPPVDFTKLDNRRDRLIHLSAEYQGGPLPTPQETPPEPRWPKGRPLHLILKEVAAKHNLSPHTIRCHSRKDFVVAARHEFFYRAAGETLHSFPSIARFLGGRDHTTVMYGVARHCRNHGLPHPRDEPFEGHDRKMLRNKQRYWETRERANVNVG